MDKVKNRLDSGKRVKPRFFWSIRNKLIFLFVIMLLIPTFIITFFSTFTMNRMSLDQINSRIRSNGIGAALLLNEEISKYDLICMNIANDNSLKMPMQLGMTNQVLDYRAALFAKNKDISYAEIYDQKGLPLFYEETGFDGVIRKAITEKKPVSGLVTRDGALEIISVNFIISSGMNDLSNPIIGAVLVIHKLDKTDPLFEKISTQLNTYLILYNNNDFMTMLDSVGKEIVPRNIEKQFKNKEVLLQKGELLETGGRIISGNRYYLYFTLLRDYMGNPAGVMGVGENDDEMQQRKESILAFMVLNLLVAVVFILLTGSKISTAFTRPIFKLMRLMKEVEKGDLSVKLDISTGDEFARLSDSFNKMVGQLAVTEERLNRAQEIASIGNWEMDSESKDIYGTREVLKLFGIPETSQFIDFSEFLRIVSPNDRNRVGNGITGICKQEGNYEDEFRIAGAGEDEERIIHVKAIYDNDGSKKIIGVFQDITQRKKIENALRQNHEELIALYEELSASEEELHNQYDELQIQKLEMEISEERYRILVNNTYDFIYSYGKDYRFSAANKSLCHALGMEIEEIAGKTHSELGFSKHYISQWMELHEELLEENETITGEIVDIDANNTKIYYSLTLAPIMDPKKQIIGVTVTSHNITDIRNKENEIKKLAYFDPLTGLPNRVQFIHEFHEFLHENRNNKKCACAILFLDIDNFKKINDTLGHSVGDDILKIVARRLKSVTGEEHIASRFGGDEFLILLKNIKSFTKINIFTARIMKLFEETWAAANNDFYLTASIGVSIYPDNGTKFEELLKNADTAMYMAKSKGKNNYQLYNSAMNDLAIKKMNIEKGLRKAIKSREFVLYYQAQVDVDTMKIRGFETLIRWDSQEFGMVGPINFIPIAEETGLIVPIGEWVIRTACRQGKKWRDEGLSPVNISVNVSAKQLKQKNFVNKVKEILKETKLEPVYLELEITESMFIESFETAVESLNELRALGVKISLDDFGTGYSSLNYLKKLPINTLKIDKSFVDDINSGSIDTTIIDLIIALVHKMKIEVIAEGVESLVQYDYLEKNRCDVVQGYLFSKPIPVDEATGLLKKEIFELVKEK